MKHSYLNTNNHIFGYLGDSFHCIEGSSGLPINLILSPYFYYYFREAMPVTSVSKAKKLAQGVLEGRLPEGEYSFYVFPTNEKMVFEIIAFDRERFESILKSSKIPKDRVKNISFAAIEFKEEFLTLYEGRLIGQQEGYFFDIDASLLPYEGEAKTSLKSLLKGKNALNFKISYGKRDALEKAYEFAETNYLHISASFLILAFSFLFLSISTINAISALDEKKSELSSTLANMNPTQLKYLKEEYSDLHKSQKKIRDAFNKVLALEGTPRAYLSSLSFKSSDGWRLGIKAEDRALAENFIAPLGGDFIEKQKDIYTFKAAQ